MGQLQKLQWKVQNSDLVEIGYNHKASLREVRGQLKSKDEEHARVKVRKEKQVLESSGGDRRCGREAARDREVEKKNRLVV